VRAVARRFNAARITIGLVLACCRLVASYPEALRHDMRHAHVCWTIFMQVYRYADTVHVQMISNRLDSFDHVTTTILTSLYAFQLGTFCFCCHGHDGSIIVRRRWRWRFGHTPVSAIVGF
jgi:hypothetical protein